jgi:hypothetical protein
LAFLSALAENPYRVQKLFITKKVNHSGIYLINFYINNKETAVIVDDYLPTKNGRPIYAHSKQGELWVPLLEKAWAKVHGSYSRTEGGHCGHAAS